MKRSASEDDIIKVVDEVKLNCINDQVGDQLSTPKRNNEEHFYNYKKTWTPLRL